MKVTTMNALLRTEVQKKFAAARARNQRYSLRAFARSVGLNHSAMSELMSGKRKFSPKKATEIAMKMGLSVEKIRGIGAEAAAFAQNVDENSQAPRRAALEMRLDQFEAIAGWLPFALLSLMETDAYRWDVAWLSQRLRVPKREIISTAKRLLRLGLVTCDEDQQYKATGEGYATPEFIANEAMRFHHLQNLDAARKSLELDPIDDRYFSSMTMAIDPDKLPAAKLALAKFRDQFCTDFEKKPKKEVYRLVLQFFPLTH